MAHASIPDLVSFELCVLLVIILALRISDPIPVSLFSVAFSGQEKKLVEEVFNNAIDCLSDEDKMLPQVKDMQHSDIKEYTVIGQADN